ncbi:unnamed protein product [Durusdinium trenchii]|uniref:Uncharacterized protein n=1 Tax=Durusdinium trenchii TaxID=1381693 RepID=A0ABP0H8U3_9DINO
MRFRDFLANVGDLADRARLLPDSSIPGDRDTIRHDLDRLLAFLNGHCASLPLCAKSIKLRALLAAAFSEQFLIGRRFIDQLRAPKRPSGRAASVLSGPRTAEEEEEEAQAFGHPSDETERDDAEDGFDLEEELAAIDKIDEEELGLDDDEEAPEDLEDDEVPTGLVAGVALLFASARDEMISAVNSLPLKGRMVHKRVVVAKLRKSAQVAPRNVVLGLPDVMKKLAGLTCPGLRLPSLLHWMVPRLPQASLTRHVPSLKGARVKRDKSNGNSAENKNKCETARPSSPYQLSFFLPERSTSSEEERQQQIRGVLEARNPVGFPCHVNAGDDFFLLKSFLQSQRFVSSLELSEHQCAGEGGGVLASNALEALQAVRESIRASLLEPAKDAAGQMRKLPGTRSNGNPEEALDKLLEVVSEVSERLNFSIDHGMKFQESVARGKKRRTRMKEAARAEVLLTGEETRLVDFLRPLASC